MNLYCTADRIGIETGGGKVTAQELLALKERGGDVIAIGGEVLGSHANPFATDDVAASKVTEVLQQHKVTYAHFYAGTFSKTVALLKANGVKVGYTAAAHDKEESISEFKRLGYDYPFTHMTDPKLWDQYVTGYRLADLIVCPSRRGVEIMQSYGCTGKLAVIPHGVESPKERKPFPKNFAVGYLGQAGPDKGIPYLIRAWRQLNWSDARLLLAGNQIDTFLMHTRRSGSGNIQLMGFVKSPSDLFNTCSVYVQPSVTEGFGIEILEAMAHGRPVIAAAGAGASEIVKEGVTGFVVPIRDVDAIADKVSWLREHPKEAEAMGAAGVERVKGLSWDKIRAAYVKVWNGL